MEEPSGPPPHSTAREATRHARELRRLRSELAIIKAEYKAEKAELSERLEEATAILNRRIEWHASGLALWHRKAHAAGEVTKTVRLPYGTSKLAKPKVEIVVEDEDALRAHSDEVGWDDVFPVNTTPADVEGGAQQARDPGRAEGRGPSHPTGCGRRERRAGPRPCCST